MPLRFSWDPRKAAANLRKHRVSFPEAAEERFLLIGLSKRGRLVLVALREQGDDIRLISARLATRRERTTYEEDQ